MRIRVVAAVLRDAQGRVLIAQRPAGKHMAGYWEFPGGKIAAGETPEQALARELAEELGVTLSSCRELLQLEHAYADRRVQLRVYTVEAYTGTPAGLEGQGLKWVAPQALAGEALLPADQPIVAAINGTGRAPAGAAAAAAHSPGAEAPRHIAAMR